MNGYIVFVIVYFLVGFCSSVRLLQYEQDITLKEILISVAASILGPVLLIVLIIIWALDAPSCKKVIFKKIP